MMCAQAAVPGWGRNLLSRPGAALLADLEKALAATARAFPVPGSHRRDLPFAVRDLSRLLTSERADMTRSYWSSPRFLSAYLHYFLPWNLYRMAWLLPSLDLGLASGARILDLGSGPLTLPLALWCARPELRSLPLSFICADVAAKPMELGRAILEDLGGESLPWRISLARAPLEKALAGPAQDLDCVMAGNMLNELSPSRRTPLEQRLEHMLAMARDRLAPGGRILLVEPGTRLGGKLVALARRGALRLGLAPLAPCTHDAPCPMLDQRLHDAASPLFSGWCHFAHPAEQVPPALAHLAERAGMMKDGLALSCLLLQRPVQDTAAARSTFADDDSLEALEALYEEIMEEDGPVTRAADPGRPNFPEKSRAPFLEKNGSRLAARIISAPIRLPDQEEAGRYACCEQGLALLLDAARIPSGAFALARSEDGRRDSKTGALLLRRTATFSEKAPGTAPGRENVSARNRGANIARPEEPARTGSGKIERTGSGTTERAGSGKPERPGRGKGERSGSGKPARVRGKAPQRKGKRPLTPQRRSRGLDKDEIS